MKIVEEKKNRGATRNGTNKPTQIESQHDCRFFPAFIFQLPFNWQHFRVAGASTATATAAVVVGAATTVARAARRAAPPHTGRH